LISRRSAEGGFAEADIYAPSAIWQKSTGHLANSQGVCARRG